jgi:hypothetical protein
LVQIYFGEENSSLLKKKKEPGASSKGDHYRIVRKGLDDLKILFLRTMKPEKLNFT